MTESSMDAEQAAGAAQAGTSVQVRWLAEPQRHDFPAAVSYLSLVASGKQVAGVVRSLRRAAVARFKAKDILRASGLPLLGVDNPHVAADLAAIAAGTALSPCLLVRGDGRTGAPAQIADGYHRVCASYHVDENTEIPVLIARWP